MPVGKRGDRVSRAGVRRSVDPLAAEGRLDGGPEDDVSREPVVRVLAGLIVGAQGGNGALRVDGTTKGYYQTASLSAGLQAGAQKFGYAMFFQSDEALAFLDRSGGWDVGTGPNIVVVDRGAATKLSNTTLKDDIYVFFFDQKGLMAGAGIQGSKISKIEPDK